MTANNTMETRGRKRYEHPSKVNPLNCKQCDKYSIINQTNYCSSFDGEPRFISRSQMYFIERVGCASHPAAEQDVKELFRKEIAKWKDEDPLFMSYVYGEEAGKKQERERLLERIYNRLNALYETVELHGHYRRILTDSDIESLFVELKESLRGGER